MKTDSLLIRVSTLILAMTLSFSVTAKPVKKTDSTETAVFAGGCFWCTESDFEKVDGVVEAISGYTAGKEKNPSYKRVSAGVTGHTEAVQVIYDPKKVSYTELLDIYWRSIDPTVKDKQFCDTGSQYRTGIYYQGDAQKKAAKASLAELQKSGRFKQIYTEVEALDTFYEAEGYHQNYYKENPVRYNYYRYSCGRDKRLKKLWGKDAYTH